MDEIDFEGSLVLEKLAEIDEVESFYEAIDNDDLPKVRALLKKARVDADTIRVVLEKITTAENDA